MGEIISFGKEADKGNLGRIEVHPMLMQALDDADRGTGASLDTIEQYLADLNTGMPAMKAIARAIVSARQISAAADIL
jgi:hypothetical protein